MGSKNDVKVRINGYDLPLVDGDIQYELSAVSEFSVKVHQQRLLALGITINIGDPIAIYIDGVPQISGFSILSPEKSIDKSGIVLTEVKCRQDSGLLISERAWTSAHFQNTNVISALTSILGLSTDFTIGDTSTVSDPSAVITADLRSKETLFSQITGVIESTQDINWRYGGFDGVNHLIDFGSFGDDSFLKIVKGHNLIDIKEKKESNTPYKDVYATGGASADVPATLQGALNIQPTLSTDPDYPIVTDARGELVVRNNAVSSGFTVNKEFKINKTENSEPPSQLEIDQAGLSLYNHAVRFLQENQTKVEYSVTVAIESLPKVGQTVYLKAEVDEIVYDQFTQREVTVNTFEVDDSFYVISYSVKLGESAEKRNALDNSTSELFIVDMTISNKPFNQPKPDAATSVYKRLENPNGLDTSLASTRTFVEEVVVNHNNVISDCTVTVGAGTVNSKTFSFAPSAPSWATSISFTLKFAQNGVIYELIQSPNLSPSNLIICATAAAGAAWTLASNVTVTATFIYTGY